MLGQKKKKKKIESSFDMICKVTCKSSFIIFTSIHSYVQKVYLHMFNIVDTAYSYGRESIVCSFLLDFYTGKGSSL